MKDILSDDQSLEPAKLGVRMIKPRLNQADGLVVICRDAYQISERLVIPNTDLAPPTADLTITVKPLI